jgi:hypothetical protein
MFGPDKRLVVANDLYSTMYGLNPEQAKFASAAEVGDCHRAGRLRDRLFVNELSA